MNVRKRFISFNAGKCLGIGLYAFAACDNQRALMITYHTLTASARPFRDTQTPKISVGRNQPALALFTKAD